MQLVFATNNTHKINEVQVLIPNHIQLLSLKDIGCMENIPETQNTIKGNAIEKAKYIKKNYGYDCFADDTGLEVTALNGAPGAYSARYAGQHCNANDNMEKLLQELEQKNLRTAQFKTVVALFHNNKFQTFTGICQGHITKTRLGDKGFGYDPVFKPNGYKQTFAQMDLTLKNKIGHRGKAINQLILLLNS